MPGPRTKSVAQLFGLPDAARTGRERLVATAVELFYRHGFGAVGVDQIITTAGVAKTTFYKHFASKDDLMVAAVLRRDEWERQAWDRAVRKLAGDDPIRQFLATLDVMDLWFNAPDFHGCMFVNAATEFPNPHDPVHQAASARMKRMRAQRRDLAQTAGATPAAAEIFADCFTALLEGAFVLRQSYGRNDAARVLRPALGQLVDVYLRAPATARRIEFLCT
ncbi:MAG TPA: TetR/AcrR family transcriptional regulator [Planctomycetota bacterium]|nr:TetR/AcrR family transcriptional regulator [Planctomycetota bacterium]